MKKLLQLVRVEKYPGPGGGIQLSFVPYKPETETVNPVKESFDKMKRALKDRGRELPPDLQAVFDSLTEMTGMATPQMMYAVQYNLSSAITISMEEYLSSAITISMEEYEALGRPTVGALVSLEIGIEKEPT